MQHLNTASSTWRRRRRRTLLLFTLCSVLQKEEEGRERAAREKFLFSNQLNSLSICARAPYYVVNTESGALPPF